MPLSDEQQEQLGDIQGQEQQFDPNKPGPGDGQPGPGKPPAKVVALPGTQPKAGASPQGLAPDAIDRIVKGTQEGTSGIKQDIPDNLSFQPKAGQDNYLLRAQDQGFMSQLSKTVGNLLPNVASDMLDMVGQLANVGGTIQGASDYNSGGIGQLATAIRDPFGEVYREHPDKTFDMGDSAWWLQHIAGFVEGAASFVIPGEGEAAAFSKLGQVATEVVGAGRLGIEATRVLGHTLSAFSMGYLMSASSGKKVYDQAYAANYDRFIRQGYDPQSADDQAKHLAAQGAARTVQLGTMLNGVLNLTALLPLFRESPQSAIANTFRSGEGAIQEGESLSNWKARMATMTPEASTAGYRQGLTSHGFQAFQVGLQGLNMEYAEKHGMEVGTGQASNGLDAISDYFDKITDQEGGLNMLTGLLGGLTQNILMDRVPLHSIIKIDPQTNKPLYKNDPNLVQEGGKTQYQTELVSARTRDMMNNRQYFSSIRDAVMQDAGHIKSLTDLWQDAKTKGDSLNADRYRRQLTYLGDLNAITLGMTENWQKTYELMAQQHPDHKPEFTEAVAQLKDLQDIHDRIADKFAPYQQDPDVGRLQDHIFNQEANHYLMGKAIDKEGGLIARDEKILGPLHDYNNQIAVYGKVKDKIQADVDALDKAVDKGDHVGMAKVMQKYGVNAYERGDLSDAAKILTERLKARATANNQRGQDAISSLHADTGFAEWEKANPGKSLTDYLGSVNRDYPVDDRLAERKAALEKARIEHEEMGRNLAEVNSSRGSDKFIKAVKKNAADWQKQLDDKAARSTENLFLKQQDKETAAKLDKNQQIKLYNDTRSQRLANDDRSAKLSNELARHQADLTQLEGKQGFFKHFTDLGSKKDLRSKIASIKAEMAHIDLQNAGHDKTMASLSGVIQDSAIKEDTVRNAHREDVQNDMHTQQDTVAPTVTEQQPDSGIPASAVPDRPAEDTYATLHASLAPRLQTVLDNLELVMPESEDFHRDLVYNAFYPAVANQEISEERVQEITEKMKDWWDERQSQPAPVPSPALSPTTVDPIMAQDTQVSPIPEPDSPLISYNAALNVDTIESAQIFREVGAKATTAMKINSRSIEYMRVEKGNHISFLPMYDKLDPTFNRNLLKPGFVSEGDAIHFQVDTDWHGQVTLDNTDAPDEYGMPTGREDSFSNYSTPDGKIIMTRQAAGTEPLFANAPIKIVHTKSGETLGYLPRVDWVTAKRPDSENYRNIEDNVSNEDGTSSGGNVEAQRAKLLALRATIAQAHNEGRAEPIRTHISDTGPGHLFLSTDVNVNTENSKLSPKLAKNLLPDKKLQFAILDKGTMMIGHGVPHSAPANFDAESLAKKYQTEGQQWRNTPMVLLPMPNGKVSESPLFTRQLEKRPADIHTVSKVIESYLAHGTAAETGEHRGIIDKINQHTGYDISNAKDLRSFINQYYTYTQPFNEVHTRSNAEVSGPRVPRFMLDIPADDGSGKSAIKAGTSFSGSVPVYALTRDGKINPAFDQVLRDGLTTHYKNVVYTSQDIKGINDKRPITAVTIQKDGKVRTDRFDSYNEYLKSFATTAVYGLHQAGDGSYLYGANPITEFDFNEAVSPVSEGAAVRTEPLDEEHEELIRQMMNMAVAPELPEEKPTHEIKMQPDNVAKINSGDKTTTTRSASQAKEIGLAPGETGVVKFGDKLYDVTARGLQTIEEAGGKEAILKAEGVKSVGEFKYDQTKAWADGSGKLHVYDIKPHAQSPGNIERRVSRDDLTLDEKRRPVDESTITENIGKLYDEAAANPEQTYHIDIPGAGKSRFRLADNSFMSHFKLAHLLNSREIPYNIKLSDDIRSALENTPRRFLNGMMFEDDSMYSPLPIDEKILGEQLDNTFVPVRGDDGGHTGGYFSPERQGAVVDSIVKAISLQLDKRPVDQRGRPIKVGDYMNLVKNNVFGNLQKIYQRVGAGEKVKGFDITPEQATNLTREFRLVLNSLEPHAESLSFWGEALKKLDGLGIRIKERRPADPDRVPDNSNGNDEVMKEAEGAGVRDWFDSHFEQNPMDSASSRIRMFIATTTDSTVGSEAPPATVSLSFNDPKVRQDIVRGTKLFTTRTPEQAKALGLDRPGAEALTKVDGKDFRVTAMGPLQEGDVHADQIGMEEGTTPATGDMKLQLTPWRAKPEQLIPNRNYLGLPKLADYEQLYEDAMASLGDTPRDLNGYIAKLKDDGLNGKPNLYSLATNLEKTEPQTQNEFVSVMTLHYQPFTMVLADSKTDEQGKPYYVLRPINTNRASQLNTLVDHWQQSQKFSPILHKDATGTTVVNKELAQQLKTGLHDINKAFNTSDKTAPNQAKELMRKVFESNGVVLPEKGLDSLIANTARWTKKTSLAGDFRKQFAITADGKAQGLVSAFVLRLAGEGSPDDVLDSNSDKSYQLNNPLYMEGTAMKVLARVAAAFTPNLYSNTHRSGEGKSIYDWGLPHKLSNDFQKLKSNEQWRAQFQESDFAKRSWLLEHMANNAEGRDRAGLSYLDTIRAAYGKQDSGTTRPKMSDREQLLTAVGLFQNGNSNRYAHYLSLTHSDRSTTPVFMNMPRIPIVTQMKLEYDKLSGMNLPKFQVHDEVIKRLYDVFLSEYDRINKASQVISKEGGYNDEHYEKGSQNFYMLPQFNHDRMAELVKAGRITEGDFNSVWMMGDKKLNVLEGRGFKDAVDKVLRQHIEELMGNSAKEWVSKGIVDGENVPFDREYIEKLLSHVGIYSNKDGTYRTRENQAVPAPYITKLSTQLAARDYAVNSFLFNASLSQVFFGDPAQNFKGNVDKTMVEYGKRLTQFISPRKEGNWDQPTYRSVTVKDFTTNANYLGDLSRAYRDINATDAQELTTVQEKLDVLRAYGRIPQQTYLEMSQIIKDAKGGYYEFTKPDQKAIVMQPEKPLYSGSRPPFQGAILNDYVKSSAYALYPPLTAGKELDSLRTAMEKGGIARLNFESAKKVGIPAVGIQLFDSQGRIRPGVFDSLAWTGTDKGQPVQSARQELSRDNFGLSQEVPYDETKDSIRTVSQMNKLITEAIPTIKAPFEYKGEKLSGTQLSLEKENIRNQLVDINHQKLLDETGAVVAPWKSGEVPNLIIKDRQKMYDALLKHAEEQGGYSPNDLAILQHTVPNTDDLIVPLMYSPNASKFESLVMSMVNGISDIYIPGKSYVQASSAGHRQVKSLGELSPEEAKNMIHVGDWDGGELKMLHKDDAGKVQPAQVILPFNFQIKGRSVPVEDYVTVSPDGRRTIDSKRIPPELLQLVGARIPNSGHNLMLPAQIVGFVPSTMGDLVIVPDAITRQMGSDFDVDKLYTYRRGYKAVPPPETSSTEPQHANMQAEHAYDMWDTGKLNGTPESKEAAAKVDEQILAGNEKIGGGESLHDVEDRVLPHFKNLLATAPDGTVVVTHSSVIKLLEQWDAEGRKSDRIDPKGYVNRSTSPGDEIPFKSTSGTLWVVRHGETTDNQAGKFRTTDATLTDKGVQQSTESGRTLRKEIPGEVPQMYTSTMPRAIHSGNLINEAVNGKQWSFEQDNDSEESQLKNNYFDTHWSVLTNPDMTNKILSPLDKEDLKDEAAQIEKWKTKDKAKMSFYDPVYQMRDFQSQKDAKRLVGASSLSVTFNSVIQDKGLTIGYMEMSPSGVSTPVIEPIEIVDEDGKKRELTHLSGYGQSEYRKDGEKTGQMRTKNDNHVMQQAEFLDYSKNRISDKVHLTVQSYPASAALTQLQEADGEQPGWAPSIKYNARLLSQPIIQEYSQEMAQAQDTFSEDFDPDRKNTIIDQLTQKYLEAGKVADIPREHTVSFEDLTDALKKGPAQKDYHLKQVAALQLFKQLEQVGTQMMTAQNTINQDVNGAGPNLLTTMGKDTTRTNLEMATQSGVQEAQLKILHAENLYTRPDGRPTEQGHLYDTVHQAAYGIAGEFFPYRDMKPMFDYVMEHTNRQDLSVDMQKSIFNAMKSYLFSHPKLGLWADPVSTRSKLLYGEESLAKRVLEAKNTWARNDLFLQRLQPDIDPDGLRPDYLKYQASKITKLDMDENTRHWVDLLTSEDPQKAQLGHELVRYAYLTGGIQDATNFIKFLPYSFLLGTDFGHKLRELTGGIQTMVMASAFRTQVFQHNPQIAKNISPDFRETGGTMEKYPERFTLPAINPEASREGPAKNLIVRAMDTSGKKRDMYPEFISHYSKGDGQWILYRKASLFNGSELGCNYVRIDTLGDANTDEYSFSGSALAQRSLIPQNRSKAYDNIEPAFRMLNSALTNGHGREVLKDFGVPQQGGQKEVADLLGKIALSDSVPDHGRVLASWLGTLQGQHDSAAEALAQVYGEEKYMLPGLKFEVLKTNAEMAKQTGSAWSAAAMDSITNKLYLSEEAIPNQAKLAEYLNHEMLHYHTAALTQIAEDPLYLANRYKGNLDVVRYAQRLYANVIEKDPEIKGIMDDLHQVRRQALDAIKEDMLRQGMSFQREYDKVTKEAKIENNWHRYIYAAASNTEFISNALTNVDFMRYLNGKKAKTPFLDRVADIVKRLMGAVSRALGTDVRKGSLLEHAIDKSMAVMLHGRAESLPDREEMASVNNMEPWLNNTNSALASPTLTAMDKLAGKLQEQHDEISNALTGRLTKEEYSEKRTKLDQIEQDVQALRENQSFAIAAEIGNRHLGWVADVLKEEKPTASQIMTANRVLEVWGNLIPLVYGSGESDEAPDPAFADISAKAQDLDFKILRKSQQALVDLSDGTLTMRDYSPERLKDISKDQGLMRDVVSAASSKVTQYVGTLLQTTSRQVLDDSTRLMKETRSMEQAVASQIGGKDQLPGFYDKFFQESKKGDAWGLVQRFSQNWYDFRRGERAKRTAAINGIDRGSGDLAQKAQAKAQVWEHYWKTVDANAIFADTRKLFDSETGERKDDAAAREHIAELEKHTDQETAGELIDEAQARYRKYLDHRQPYFDSLEGTPEEIKKAKDEFVNKWSPNVFFANRNSKFGISGGSDYYAKMAPRRSAGEFYDSKFEDIRKDPVASKYYSWLTTKMEELKNALPTKVNDEHLGANFFPVVKKSLVTDMLDIPEYIRTFSERTMAELGATPFQENAEASTFRQIPIDYVNRDTKANPIESRSKDIPRVIEAFGLMALHYKHFSEARDSIDMGESILQKLDEARTAGTTQMDIGGKLVSVKDGLKNTLDAVKYMKDYLIYRKARKLEGRTDMKLYSLNPVEQLRTSNEVKGLLAEQEKLHEQIVNGEIDPEEGSKLLAPINQRLSEFDGRRIYGSKIGDKLISINQLKTLSYNPFAAAVRMTFGSMAAGVHANGGKDFGWKDLASAMKIMVHSTAKWLSFGSKESETAYKVLAVMDRAGIIGDIVDSHYGKIKLRDNQAAWKHAVNPFNWMRSADYFMKGLTTVAMMMHEKVAVTENGENKEVSLWEAMDGQGKWNSERFGERKDWYSDEVKDQTSWDKFRNKAIRVNMITHGNQDKSSPKLANKFILGRLIGQFRMSWLPEGWYSHFQKEHFDIQLGREVKGRYQTIAQLGLGGYAIVTLKQLYSLVGKVDPYSNVTRLDGKALSDVDRENMRKNFTELAFIASIMGTVVMARAAAADSDDEQAAAKYRLLMNMLIRNEQNLGFYANPGVFDEVTRNVIPAATVLTDYGKALKATGRVIFDDDYQYQQWLAAVAHAGLPIPQANLIGKTKYMLGKDLGNSPY